MQAKYKAAKARLAELKAQKVIKRPQVKKEKRVEKFNVLAVLNTVKAVDSYAIKYLKLRTRVINKGYAVNASQVTIAKADIKSITFLSVDDDRSLTKIKNYFLKDATSFDQTLVLPSTLTEIGDYFLENCRSFNTAFSLPENVTKIADNFLYDLLTFNKTISLNSKLTTIGTNFLRDCPVYNKDITLPASLTSVSSSFMFDCPNFTSTVNIGSLAVGVFAGSDQTLAADRNVDPVYVTGCKIAGDNEDAFCEKFPNRNVYPFRRLSTSVVRNRTLTKTDGTIYYVTSHNDIFAVALTSPSSTTIETTDGSVTVLKSDIYGIVFADDDDSLTTIPYLFLRQCVNFNSDLVIPDTVTEIGDDFMLNCSAYNSTLTLSSSLEMIGDYFLNQCTNFDQRITLPETLTSIGNYFLRECAHFSQVIEFQDGLESIGDGFLRSCVAYNRELTLPNTITEIGEDFLEECEIYNSALTLPANLEIIKAGFMTDCIVFNQPLAIPNTVSVIEHMFMSGCLSFNNTITLPEGLEEIPGQFMITCSSFDQLLTIPETVTSIGAHFLFDDTVFNKTITIPEAVTAIGDSFLTGCAAFDKEITIPEAVISIGDEFLRDCTSFNQPLQLPANLTAVGEKFMCECQSMTSVINLGSLAANIFALDTEPVGTLNTMTAGTDMYVTGVKIDGDNQAAFRARFPNNDVSPYRNLKPAVETGCSVRTLNNGTIITTMTNDEFAGMLCLNNNSLFLSTSDGTEFVIPIAEVLGITFITDGSDLTLEVIGTNFLAGHFDRTGNSSYSRFVDPVILPESVVEIGRSFMVGCTVFNAEIHLPEGLQKIGNYFLSGIDFYESAYNTPLVFPSTLTEIGDHFLDRCEAFNAEISLPDGLQTIGQYFMYYCSNFNKPLSLPSSLIFIDSYFMTNTDNYTSIIDIGSIPAENFTDSTYTLATYDQSAQVYVTGVTIKGDNRWAFCSRFPDRNISPYRNLEPVSCKVYTINQGVISSNLDNDQFANLFAQTLTDIPVQTPDGIVSVPAAEILGIKFIVDGADTTLTQVPDNFLAYFFSQFIQSIELPDSVVTIGDNFMQSCEAFNAEIIIPEGVQEIGAYFLTNCQSYNQPLILPSTLVSINYAFMMICTAFNQDLSLPSSLTSIGGMFMSGASDYTSEINIGFIPAVNFENSDGSTLTNTSEFAPAYVMGVTIVGNDSQAFLDRFPNNDSPGYYRNLRRAIPIYSACTVRTNSGLITSTANNNEFAAALAVAETITIPTSDGDVTINKPDIKGITFITDGSDNTLVATPTACLVGCTALIDQFELPDSVIEIGDAFMYNCSSFNSDIILPEGLQKIGITFLANCGSYNQRLELPSTLTEIGGHFMYFCESFNKDLSLPSSVTSIGVYFMFSTNACTSTINIGSIPATCFAESLFTLATINSSAPVYVTGVTIVGDDARAFFTRFPDSDINPYRNLFSTGCTIRTLNNGTLVSTANNNEFCSIFKNPLTQTVIVPTSDGNITIPKSEVLGITFITDGSDTTLSSISNNFLTSVNESTGYIHFEDSLELPDSVIKIGNWFMGYCINFNGELIIPDSVQEIGVQFLGHCEAYNQPLTLPSDLKKIGQDFMNACASFNLDLSLPNSLTFIDAAFMWNMNNYTSTVDIGSIPPVNFVQDTLYTLSTLTASVPGYTTGRKIAGDNKIEFLLRFPNEAVSPFRNLQAADPKCAVRTLNNGMIISTANNNEFAAAFTHGTLTVTIPTSSGDIVVPINEVLGITFITDGSDTTLSGLSDNFLSTGDTDASFSQFIDPLRLPDSVTWIGNQVMKYLYAFNASVTLPSGLQTIGIHFMRGCTSFNKNLSLPSSLTFIDGYFMYGLNNYTSTVDIGTIPATNFAANGSTLTVTSPSVPAYTTGIRIAGTDKAAFLTRFPNLADTSFSIYRKLL